SPEEPCPMSLFTWQISRFTIRRFIAVIGISLLVLSLVPTPVTAAAVRTTHKTVRQGASKTWAWLIALGGFGGSQSTNRERKGLRPSPAPTKAERKAKVARLELNVADEIELKSRQRFLLSAIPVDE